MSSLRSVEASLKQIAGENTVFVRSPGRVNLLGEHTDYNEGFVLPAAIGKAIYLAITPHTDNICKLTALDMHEEHEFTPATLSPSSKRWPNYIMGVVDQLKKAGYVFCGFDCLFGGDIPIGAGMSSSAALEAGVAFGLNKTFSLGIDNLSIVKLAQKAENEFVGVKCGIMDQYVNIFGEKGKVLRIDCRTLDHVSYPFNFPGISIALFDTRVTHSLAATEYNQRRRECQEGVEAVRRAHPDVRNLRDVSREMLAEAESRMTPTVYRRCSYVVGENERMSRATSALVRKDLKLFGELMYLTHEGLRDEYAVSCEELDFLVDLASKHSSVHGARMMGGGFGGCTINLVDTDAIDALKEEFFREYEKRFSKKPNMYVTSIDRGTSEFPLNETSTD